MATAVVINGAGSWVAKGKHKTVWSSMTVNTTGDVGSVQGSLGDLSIMSVYVTGTLGSGAIQLQESNASTGTYAVAQTVCGTDLTIGSSTDSSNLTTGTVYMVRPGALFYKPKVTAGASGTVDAEVVFVQSQG